MDSSNNLVTVFGASGFVGTRVVQELLRSGYRVRAAVRRPDLAGHLKPLGGVGQIGAIQANIRDAASVQRAVNGAAAVINLVGIGFERGRQRFRAVHTMGARNVAEAARAAGVQTLVHMSAIGANPNSQSTYARSKGLGEQEVLSVFPEAIIFRPSLMFGPGDGFFNQMGGLTRMLPVFPLIGGKSRFQPVYVGDVDAAFLAAVEGRAKPGRIYELGGPEVLTNRELMGVILKQVGRNRPLLPVPAGIAKLMALPFAVLPFRPLLTADQVELLGMDNIVSVEAQREKRTFAAFGIQPTAMAAVLSTYMWRFRKHGQYDRQPA